MISWWSVSSRSVRKLMVTWTDTRQQQYHATDSTLSAILTVANISDSWFLVLLSPKNTSWKRVFQNPLLSCKQTHWMHQDKDAEIRSGRQEGYIGKAKQTCMNVVSGKAFWCERSGGWIQGLQMICCGGFFGDYFTRQQLASWGKPLQVGSSPELLLYPAKEPGTSRGWHPSLAQPLAPTQPPFTWAKRIGVKSTQDEKPSKEERDKNSSLHFTSIHIRVHYIWYDILLCLLQNVKRLNFPQWHCLIKHTN